MGVGFDEATAFLTSDHRFSVGLRSGDFGGHYIWFTELSLFLLFAFLLVCLGSLSCWKTHTSGISYSAKGSIMVSMKFGTRSLLHTDAFYICSYIYSPSV